MSTEVVRSQTPEEEVARLALKCPSIWEGFGAHPDGSLGLVSQKAARLRQAVEAKEPAAIDQINESLERGMLLAIQLSVFADYSKEPRSRDEAQAIREIGLLMASPLAILVSNSLQDWQERFDRIRIGLDAGDPIAIGHLLKGLHQSIGDTARSWRQSSRESPPR